MSPGRNRKPTEGEATEPAAKGTEGQESAAKRTRSSRTLYLDDELLERCRAAVHHLQAYVPEAGIRSLSDLIEPAAWAKVTELEATYNGGEPFKKVLRMTTGRPNKS